MQLITVDAVVLDKKGNPVPGLTKDDFQVFDDGKPQELTIFKNDIQPITIVISGDRSLTGNFNGRPDRTAARGSMRGY